MFVIPCCRSFGSTASRRQRENLESADRARRGIQRESLQMRVKISAQFSSDCSQSSRTIFVIQLMIPHANWITTSPRQSRGTHVCQSARAEGAGRRKSSTIIFERPRLSRLRPIPTSEKNRPRSFVPEWLIVPENAPINGHLNFSLRIFVFVVNYGATIAGSTPGDSSTSFGMKTICINSLKSWFCWVLHGGYWGIIALMAMESSIIPIPSEIVIPPAAFLAAGGNLSMPASSLRDNRIVSGQR